MVMTPRTRILAALNHQPVDRVLIDPGSKGQSGIVAITWRNLRMVIPSKDTTHLAGSLPYAID